MPLAEIIIMGIWIRPSAADFSGVSTRFTSSTISAMRLASIRLSARLVRMVRVAAIAMGLSR